MVRMVGISSEGVINAKTTTQEVVLARSEEALPSSSQVATHSGSTDYTVPFKLDTKMEKKPIRIPKKIFLTGPFSNFSEVVRRRGSASLASWLGLSDDLSIHYFNDSSCGDYIKDYYDDELLHYFKNESRGSFRGDICRTAILLRDGGFYIDLDMQLRVNLTELIDDSTTFMTARSAFDGCLNALIAAVPNSPVLNATLDHMRKWYRNETAQTLPLGPITLARGLQQVTNASCPRSNWKEVLTQFDCGESNIRLYSEVALTNCRAWGGLICPRRRSLSSFPGRRYGLFSMPESHLKSNYEEKFIGWSRAEDCYDWGCRVSGGY
jgi:hypothetical protein